MSSSPAILSSNQPASPFVNSDADLKINSDQDQKVSKASNPRFPRLKAGLVSLKDRVKKQICNGNAFILSTFLAAYPIAKLMLSIIAYFVTGAAIALPPVAFGLLIAATTLFLIATLVTIYTHRNFPGKHIAKYILENISKFAFAPITAPIIAVRNLRKLAEESEG